MSLDGLTGAPAIHLDFSAVGVSPGIMRLLAQEVHEFEAVLGVPVVFAPPVPGRPRWVAIQGDAGEVPSLSWDPYSRTLTSRAQDEASLMTTFNLLHTLAHSPKHRVEAAPAVDVDGAIDRIRRECANTYPYFGLRGLDWDAITRSAMRTRPSSWDEFTPWATRWVAQLGDAHTAVIDHEAAGFNPLYTAELGPTGARLLIVPERSAAHAAGARPGWVIPVDDPDHWLTTTGASPQVHRRAAARRALAITGPEREYTAVDPETGRTVSWTETATAPTLDDVLTVERNPTGAVLVTLRAFDARVDIDSAFDDLTTHPGPTTRMVLDLRGNTGGNLLLAGRLRDRFLHTPTTLGSIAFTDARGGLSHRTPRTADPSDLGRWPGPLTVVTDASTYSAAEDFLLGLHGLDHVTVLGERTGGGSGRPRLLPLGPTTSLRISTAITYDRHDDPVEHRGIVPDGPLTMPAAAL